MIFDGLEKHCSVVQTDTAARYIININLLWIMLKVFDKSIHKCLRLINAKK
jgi:hypothetical protein